MSNDNTRRHWHGTPGDRHEQLNVWMNGGAKGPSGRASWAMPIPDTRRVCHLPLTVPFSSIIPWHYITTSLPHYVIPTLLIYPYPSTHLYISKADLTPKMKDSNTSTSSNGSKRVEDTLPNAPGMGERRGSSVDSSSGLFSNLNTQKRGSTNADMATRRASWNEQAANRGMFAKWWDGYTRGSGSK
ncbi:unnamed protein product [Penicillium nalgiovense]|uniref:Uncharacterized protein n=1 Tax=Penicillium nalgiovense TaxID=60175 RepID=A0A9W4I480_PENNA|nr:unnamed protein product [Penicillium nalgiovense]CAG8048479.1 unnamed protein product [Penicillium nalgiovense]CAG8182414.1 unnamed protein product [Penicillium nalgiovense]CAG8185368.1 unnamed protein product [Penicillium nalgiovense]CAG8198721.1 unnamed protein product [Penicillium nalgiovense]